MIRLPIQFPALLLILISISLTQSVWANISEQQFSYEHEDNELTASCYLNSSKELVFFLPNAYATMDEQRSLSSEIADNGLSTCLANVLIDLFLPIDSKSYASIPVNGMLELLGYLQNNTGKDIYLVGHGSGSRVAYKMAVLHRESNMKPAILRGMILLSPNLLDGTPEAGQQHEYMKEVSQHIMPVYIFQSSYSPHHWYLDQLLELIQKSGTSVSHQRLAGLRDGFALREDRTPEENKYRAMVPDMFLKAINDMDKK